MRFKTSRDILESHLGGLIQLTKYVKLVCDDESEVEGYTKNASEQLFAFLYLENASQDKYGSILRSWTHRSHSEMISTQEPSWKQTMC